jgi:hypothetical protein
MAEGWRALKASMGLDPKDELKYAIHEDHPSYARLEQDGWPRSRRLPAMLAWLTEQPVLLVADTVHDWRPGDRAHVKDLYVHALGWCLRRAASRATLGGRRYPRGLDPPATPRRRPGPAGAPAVIGLVARRQRRRRARIPPNSNTATTTMISTHNHVDMEASLVGAGAGQANTTAAHPGKQLPRPGDLPGRDRRPRCGRACGALAPRDLPADLGWPGTRPCVGPVGLSPWCHAQPAQPNRIDQHHKGGGPGRRQLTRRDHSESDWRGVWRGREEFALLGRGNNPSMVVLRRNGRRAAGAEPMVRAFGETRTCAEDGCTARLSRYNPARCCAIHQGWDQQETTRMRRRRP